MYWAADRSKRRAAGPVGKAKCTETEELSAGKNAMSSGPGYSGSGCRVCPGAGPSGKRGQCGTRGHTAPGRSLRSGATVGCSFLKEATRRRHDSGLLRLALKREFRTPTEIQVGLLCRNAQWFENEGRPGAARPGSGGSQLWLSALSQLHLRHDHLPSSHPSHWQVCQVSGSVDWALNLNLKSRGSRRAWASALLDGLRSAASGFVFKSG
jgi:hypothetical protein